MNFVWPIRLLIDVHESQFIESRESGMFRRCSKEIFKEMIKLSFERNIISFIHCVIWQMPTFLYVLPYNDLYYPTDISKPKFTVCEILWCTNISQGVKSRNFYRVKFLYNILSWNINVLTLHFSNMCLSRCNFSDRNSIWWTTDIINFNIIEEFDWFTISCMFTAYTDLSTVWC